MPRYEYAHTDSDPCGHDLSDVVQRMSDDPLQTCPTCGKPVHRVPQPLRGVVKATSPIDAGRVMRKMYGLQRGEQCYQVPESGEVVRLDGPKSTWRQKIADAHTRANEPTSPNDVEIGV